MPEVKEFRLPDLGEGLTEAEIVRWLVEVGEVVAVDQPVVEVETAKAMVEVPCPYGGVVTARFGAEGTELPVGAPLLTVAVGASPVDASASTGEEPEASGNVLVGYGTGAPAARRRRVRRPGVGASPTPDGAVGSADGSAAAGGPAVPDGPEAGGHRRARSYGPGAAAAEGVAGAGGEFVGRGAAPGVAAGGSRLSGSTGPVPVVSPLVRKMAREHGVDLRELTGTGRDGLILRADVERAVRAAADAAAAPPAPAAATAVPAGEGAERIPLRGLRGAVAEKLGRSRREIPDATCWVDADATELLAARRAMNAGGGPKVSLLALLARICTAALARYPDLNSTVDTEAREIVRLPGVHLGFAAQTERGLVVPVVRDAHLRNAAGLSAEIARLTEAARSGTLTPADLTGGTFTLNNYGVFGVDGSTPIINHPEAAMLGVGRIAPKPWVHQGELAVRHVVQLSFTFDHRVCDGGTAGGFLRYVADCVEQPAVLLRSL
ncbi:dihydrolipoamide acetyltransferase family protein [Streptomyces hiroshimensis]|uniref:Dihydrolipoamide acetyltransferase component of pyruvate dehydrogenase complex n=1 Tax=Streptomyces hiroshimensis TaxID=66424 RepID=A0ABQ2ZAB9_9ACTN|nr:dihydrolipoamide acetyltransferase family protein [Streptomyces hiroshimensis]GGY10137.1 dihydrolipoamide acetyltransferase component of pyruvate dehydrogenase complex [Streptomyces hiroshimensis]